VLLVEDDLSLERTFDALFYDIDSRIELNWVTSAEAALRNIEDAARRRGRVPFDLAIIDIFLDGRANGIELWNHCHRVYPQMPAVVISALPWHRFHDFIENHAVCPPYLEKPLSLSQCRQTFEEMMNRSS
jgi:DNA-binding NtrC family response regulator